MPLETERGFSFYIKYSLKLKIAKSLSQRDRMMMFPARISHILKLIRFPASPTGNMSMVPGGPRSPSAPGRPGRPGGPCGKVS